MTIQAIAEGAGLGVLVAAVVVEERQSELNAGRGSTLRHCVTWHCSSAGHPSRLSRKGRCPETVSALCNVLLLTQRQ